MSSGIPALLNNLQIPFQILTQFNAITEAIFDYLGLSQPGYGIYLNNKLALQVDGFVEFAFRDSSVISNYRIEQGAFSSYNKVENPNDLRAVVTKAGSPVDIAEFLMKLEAIKADLNLYNVVSPEHTYINCNLKEYNYRRNIENGTHIIYAELLFQEIMNTGEIGFNKPTKTQSAKPKKSGGNVQAK
jgi:hypothetical protein